MYSDTETLELAERRMRKFLHLYNDPKDNYDVLMSIFGIHTALETTLNVLLPPNNDLGENPSFPEKFHYVLPNADGIELIDSLNQVRNNFAHPWFVPDGEKLYATAWGFMVIAVANWRKFFSSAPPVIRHTEPESLAEAVAKVSTLTSNEKLLESPPPTRKKEKITNYRQFLGRTLGFGIVLLWVTSLASGFTYAAAAMQLAEWYWILAAAMVTLALGYLTAQRFWKFSSSVEWGHFIGGSAVVILLITLILMPFASHYGRAYTLSDRAGTAFSVVFTTIYEYTIGLTIQAHFLGRLLAQSTF